MGCPEKFDPPPPDVLEEAAWLYLASKPYVVTPKRLKRAMEVIKKLSAAKGIRIEDFSESCLKGKG